jgi:ATP-dependent phosphofructokinase / diphosphate-dependent phosphofructokinase
MKRIGILTGGGDAPGLNAVIRAVTTTALDSGYEVVGFERGWAGLLEKTYRILKKEDVADIHREGGTILFSSRTNVAKVPNGFETAKKNLEELEIYCLVAIGGEDTLGVARQLHDEGGRVVGAPKTIDNDVNATDYTFGFDTAINRAMEAMDRLHTTAKAHQRVMVVEIMGRHAGWMALHGGIAGGAHYIAIPESPFDIDEIAEICKARYAAGNKYAMVAIAEGAEDPKLLKAVQHSAEMDSFGHVQLGTGRGIGEVVAEEIEERTGLETRHSILGHLQRGGEPTAFDRVLGTRLGVKVTDLIDAGEFGKMAALCGGEIVGVPLADAVGELKTVPLPRYELAKRFFG